MKSYVALGVALVAPALVVLAEEPKVEKADVVLSEEAKTGSAKKGETVELQVKYPVAPPFPAGYKLTVDGKAVKFKEVQVPNKNKEGKMIVGVGITGLQFKAEGEGKQKVELEYKKGDETVKRTLELEVK